MSTPKAGDTRLLDKILGVEPRALEDDDSTVVVERSALQEDSTPPPVTDPTTSSAELPATEPLDVTPGIVVDGRYRVQRLIGRGGIGLVYLCHHEVLEKPVAMKVLRPEYAEQPDVIERFVNEARAASAIKSAHIVNTLDVGSLPSGAPYFVMEYIDAETLATRLQNEHALPLFEALEVARQMADGLAAAHGAGIVHRDLKPENVFVGRQADGSLAVKIFDFGVAKVTRAKSRLTHVGAIFGTPSYMSPEQARGQTVDPRTDVYAIGVMLFEMIAGRPPYEGDDPLAVMAQHVDAEIPSLKVTISGAAVPSAIEQVVHRCLQKSRDDRYPSVTDLLRDLERFTSTFASSEPAPELLRDSQLPEIVVPLDELSERTTPPPQVASSPAVTFLPPVASLPTASRSPVRAKSKVTTPSAAKRGNYFPWLGAAVVLVAGAWLVLSSGAGLGRGAGSADELAAEPEPAPAASVAPSRVEHEVHLVLSPLDAQVYLGEKNLGPMPVSVKVEEGKRLTVSVRRRGYKSRRVVLDGTQTRVVVGLNKITGNAK